MCLFIIRTERESADFCNIPVIENNVKNALRTGVAMDRYGLIKGAYKLNTMRPDSTVWFVSVGVGM